MLLWRVLNWVTWIVRSLIGVAIILMGVVWSFQGLNPALRVGFLVGNHHWTIYGVILALIGGARVLCSNSRQIPA